MIRVSLLCVIVMRAMGDLEGNPFASIPTRPNFPFLILHVRYIYPPRPPETARHPLPHPARAKNH